MIQLLKFKWIDVNSTKKVVFHSECWPSKSELAYSSMKNQQNPLWKCVLWKIMTIVGRLKNSWGKWAPNAFVNGQLALFFFQLSQIALFAKDTLNLMRFNWHLFWGENVLPFWALRFNGNYLEAVLAKGKEKALNL